MRNLKERTLVLIKPDGVKRALMGKIISRFEDAGFTIIGMKLIKPSTELAKQHYSCDSMQRKQMGLKALNTLKENHVDTCNVFGTHDVESIGAKILDWNIEYLTSGPVLALVIEGFEAITKIRDICGRGHPLKSNIGTIRGDFSSVSSTISAMYAKATPNLVHASDNSNDNSVPEKEINLWFLNDELIAYENIHHYSLL